MTASVINQHHNTTKDEWTQKVGALAWAPYPNIISTPSQPWPCLIYPSWSNAILNSGLFPVYHPQNGTVCVNGSPGKDGKVGGIDSSNPIIDGCNSVLEILSCKKRVKLSDLANNRVPLRVALNPGRNDGDLTSPTSPGSCGKNNNNTKPKKRRSKVVVHFLGLNEWYVASIGDLTQYTVETSLKFIKQFREHIIDENDGGDIRYMLIGGEKKNVDSARTGTKNRKRKNDNMDDWWDIWLLAMKEASIACEKESLDPAILVAQCKDGESKSRNNTTGGGSSTRKLINSTNINIVAEPSGQTKERIVSMQKQENPTKANNLVEQTVKCTPECFDDWRMGGNTERFSDTSQSQFLLTNQSKTQ